MSATRSLRPALRLLTLGRWLRPQVSDGPGPARTLSNSFSVFDSFLLCLARTTMIAETPLLGEHEIRHANQLRTVEPSSRLGAQPSKPRLAFFRRLVLARHGCVELKLQQREAVHRHRRMKPGCFRAGLVVYAQVVALCTRREVQVGTVLNAQNHGSAPSVRSLCVARIFSGVTAEGSSRGRQAVKPGHCRHTRRHREGRTWHLRRVHCQPDASPDACLPTAHLVLGPAFSRQALANRHRNDRPGAQRRPATRLQFVHIYRFHRFGRQPACRPRPHVSPTRTQFEARSDAPE